MATKTAVMAKAASQIGYKELPVNRTKYGKWIGQDGAAWCHSFVSWVAGQCGASSIIPRTASTVAGASWFRNKGRFHSTPKAGDIAYFRFPTGPARIHHAGYVEKVRADGMLVTIEGNTSTADNRNGGCVMRRVRNPKYVVGYGRPAYSTAVAKPTNPSVKYPVSRKIVNVQSINLRATPKGKITVVLKAGQTVKQTGPVKDGWMPVTRLLRKGWIAARHNGKPTTASV